MGEDHSGRKECLLPGSAKDREINLMWRITNQKGRLDGLLRSPNISKQRSSERFAEADKEFQCMVPRKRKGRNRNVRRNLRVIPEQALMFLPIFECLRLKSQRWSKQHLPRKPSCSNYFVPLCSKSSVYPGCKKCDFALQA